MTPRSTDHSSRSLTDLKRSYVVATILNYVMERLDKANGDSIMLSVKWVSHEIRRRLNVRGSSRLYQHVENVLSASFPDLPFTSKHMVNRSYIITKV